MSYRLHQQTMVNIIEQTPDIKFQYPVVPPMYIPDQSDQSFRSKLTSDSGAN
jgi:hypothetical protein